MKKNLLLSALALGAMTMNAEVTLQHTFQEGEATSMITYDAAHQKSLFYSDDLSELNGNAYYGSFLDTATKTLTYKRYNMNYELEGTTVFNIPTLEGYYISSASVTKSIFDDDAKSYELIVTYHKSNYDWSTEKNEIYKVIVYTEKGAIIKDFGTASNAYVSNYLHVYNNEYRLWVEKVYYDADNNRHNTYEVYTVDKKSPVGLREISVEELPKKFVINGNLYIMSNGQITDAQGRTVTSAL